MPRPRRLSPRKIRKWLESKGTPTQERIERDFFGGLNDREIGHWKAYFAKHKELPPTTNRGSVWTVGELKEIGAYEWYTKKHPARELPPEFSPRVSVEEKIQVNHLGSGQNRLEEDEFRDLFGNKKKPKTSEGD